MIFVLFFLLFGVSEFVNVRRSSIRGPDPVIIENGVKYGLFFAFELKRFKRQLTSVQPGLGSINVNKKAKPTTKFSIHLLLQLLTIGLKCSLIVCRSLFLSLVRYPALSSVRLIYCCFSTSLKLIRLLLFRGCIERNPGPFQIVSQNCRGLTDRIKLRKVFRSIYPANRTRVNLNLVACLQETHSIDVFSASIVFNGKIIADNGERNQRGVCILVPDGFEVCSQEVSGIGRWAIAVIKQNVDLGTISSPRKVVVASIYAPNCHRESLGFFQEFFLSYDEICAGLDLQDEVYDQVIAGDFNLVLDYDKGAVNRTTTRTERDLATLAADSMATQDLIEC